MILKKEFLLGGGIWMYDDRPLKFNEPFENYRPVLRFTYSTDEQHPNQLKVVVPDDSLIDIVRESIDEITRELNASK